MIKRFKVRVQINGRQWHRGMWINSIDAQDVASAQEHALEIAQRMFPRCEVELTGGVKRDRREEARIERLIQAGLSS